MPVECRGFSWAFNGDGGEAYSGPSGGRGGREFGRGSWSGKPLFPKSLAPNGNACREDSGNSRRTRVPTHKVRQSHYLTKTTSTPLCGRIPRMEVMCPAAASPGVSRGVANHGVPQVTTGGVKVFGCRVVQILRGRVHGLYQMQVESQYKKTWGEELPDSWLDTMAGSS